MLNKINEYIEAKRAMGFKFRIQASLLTNYARYVEQQGESFIRRETVLRWADIAPSPEQKRNRLLTVRRFAIAMHAEDRRHEIPPADVFGYREAKRKIRRLFSDNDIRQLMVAASRLTPQETIRPRTYSTLFGLLAVSGIRIGEAIALNIQDVTEDGLIIQSTKFKIDRLVPLHESSHLALKEYLKHRKKINVFESALFVSNHRKRLTYVTVNHTFLRLMRSIGLRRGPGQPGACIHDLRHSFAVKSLEQSIGSTSEIMQHMLALSTYLGHAHISDTFWYLQATPTLLSQISQAQAGYLRRYC